MALLQYFRSQQQSLLPKKLKSWEKFAARLVSVSVIVVFVSFFLLLLFFNRLFFFFKYLEKDPPREQKQTKKYAKNLMKLTEGQGKSFTVVLKEQVIDRLLRAYNYGTSTTPNSKRRRREVNTPAKVEAKTATDVSSKLNHN